jgi:nitrogen fixation/metabolism regulation signal transduction histidine kinase
MKHIMGDVEKNRHDSKLAERPGSDNALSARQLAHELNNHLDGSLRCLRLAEQSLSDSVVGDDAALKQAQRRIELARRAMHDMAQLLDRALRSHAPTTGDLATDLTIDDMVQRIVAAIEPIAGAHDIALHAHVAPDVRALPAGVLGALIRNGIDNAVAACTADGLAVRCVELSIARSRAPDRIVVLITDTGPGAAPNLEPGETTRPDGHGVGLDLCRRIVDSLDGALSLMNIPFGGGAVLRIELPIDRLEHA